MTKRQRGPVDDTSRWSSVARGTSSVSARATYQASYAVTAPRNSQTRLAKGAKGQSSMSAPRADGRQASGPLSTFFVNFRDAGT